MRHGFSLLEVLVTLTIASVSLAALGRSARSIVQARRASERLQAATLIAERRIEAMITAGADALAAEFAIGTEEDAAGEFRVTTRVEPGPNDALWLVAVDVAPSTDGASVELRTLLRKSSVAP